MSGLPPYEPSGEGPKGPGASHLGAGAIIVLVWIVSWWLIFGGAR